MLELMALAGCIYLCGKYARQRKSVIRGGGSAGRGSPCFVIEGPETPEQLEALGMVLPLLLSSHSLPETNLVCAAELSHDLARTMSSLSGRYKYLLRKSYELGHSRGPAITAYLHEDFELKAHQSLYVIWYEGVAVPFVLIADSSQSAFRLVQP